jgi:hypothetical protein
MKRLVFLLVFPVLLFAQTSKQQCRDFGGTWSSFKGRCDQTHKHFFKDKQTWGALALIGANVLTVSLSANHVKDGGTFAFGNNTTSGGIALVGIATFGAMLGFQRVNWYLGHDDPSKAWRETSYWLMPGMISGATAAEIAGTNWGHKAGPYPIKADLSHIEIRSLQ